MKKDRRLTKVELLPLSTADVKRLSLKHHLALAALRTGHADVDLIATLMNVVSLAFFLRPHDEADVSVYADAQTTLNCVVERMHANDGIRLLPAELEILERVVVQHDAQLASTPVFRLMEAWSQLGRNG